MQETRIMKNGIDVSKYRKAPKKTTRLNERHTVPVSIEMKERIERASSKIKINEALRDCLEQILEEAERVA